MSNKKWLVNKYDLSFFFISILFFFSENTINIDSIDIMFGMLERYKVKYILALIFCAIYWIKSSGKKELFHKEFTLYLNNILILGAISIISILIGQRQTDIVNELLYFLVPLFFAYSLINARKGQMGGCIDCFFWIMLVGFLVRSREKLSISSIASINFVKSYSPFEGEIAFLAMLLVFYYSWKGDRFKQIISLTICILSFKRVTFICAILVVLFMKWIQKKECVSRRERFCVIALFMFVPVIMNIICTDWFARVFNNLTGMDFDLFVKGRFFAMNTAFDNYHVGGGLGSLRIFLSEYFRGYYNTMVRTYDLHCDIVRFYLECTALGLFSLLYSYIKSAKTASTMVFMTYVFLECCVNHMFGGGRSFYWILAYMIIFEFNCKPACEKFSEYGTVLLQDR